MAKKIEVYESCGNVFADLGLPNAERLLAKAKLTTDILATIRRRRFSYARAATMVGLDRGTLRQVLLRDFDRFSVRRLTGFLAILKAAPSSAGWRRSGRADRRLRCAAQAPA